jgi:protein involved in polysaccharide export with SLBB domain
MRVTDLIRAGGFLRESAYAEEAELARYVEGETQTRETRLISIDLAAALRGDAGADIDLQPHDVLTIREKPLWRDLEEFKIEGEVQFPGPYPIRRGETLSSLLERAGGLTDLAFPDGAIFLRDELRLREQAQIDELTSRLESEVEASAESVADLNVKSVLLDRVRETQATGRLVIDLAAVLAGNRDSSVDIEVQDGDRLLIPRRSRTVTIIGEVQFPTTYVYEAGISRNAYIAKSGGLAVQADKKRIYIVRADGSVVASSRSLFNKSRDVKAMRPGDTIVVPIQPDSMSALSFWTSVTTIIYNIGVAAAAVASF